jgi:hypothetical protein
MVQETSGLKTMGAAAVGLVSLAAISLAGLAVLTGFKGTYLVDNTTANNFIAGIAIFGAFAAVIAIGLVGKIIIGIFRKGY